MEANHLSDVEQLQKEYDAKLDLQMSDYLKLEQEKLEMRKEKEQQIAELQAENDKSISKLLEEFRENLNKVQDEYEESRRASKVMSTKYGEKVENMTL